MKRRIVAFLLAVATLAALAAQDKPDALKLYRNGRDLDSAGRTEDAKNAYTQAMDAYAIYGWSLVRLGKYKETTDVCLEALKISSDARIQETLGEGYFYLANYRESLKYMEKYIDAAPKGERISTAYFFVGEIYRMMKEPGHAEFAYTSAVYLEPSIALWWYRLGGTRESLGDKTGATAAYQRALKLRPDYKEATDGLSRVRT
jgi:tetratricopeptide (TPR) repeat protein